MRRMERVEGIPTPAGRGFPHRRRLGRGAKRQQARFPSAQEAKHGDRERAERIRP